MDEGRIAHEVSVTLPRPRAVDDPVFAAARSQLLGWLGVAQPVGAAVVREALREVAMTG